MCVWRRAYLVANGVQPDALTPVPCKNNGNVSNPLMRLNALERRAAPFITCTSAVLLWLRFIFASFYAETGRNSPGIHDKVTEASTALAYTPWFEAAAHL